MLFAEGSRSLSIVTALGCALRWVTVVTVKAVIHFSTTDVSYLRNEKFMSSILKYINEFYIDAMSLENQDDSSARIR
jgi:hypothetical protein